MQHACPRQCLSTMSLNSNELHRETRGLYSTLTIKHERKAVTASTTIANFQKSHNPELRTNMHEVYLFIYLQTLHILPSVLIFQLSLPRSSMCVSICVVNTPVLMDQWRRSGTCSRSSPWLPQPKIPQFQNFSPNSHSLILCPPQSNLTSAHSSAK